MNPSDALHWAGKSTEWLVPLVLALGVCCVAAMARVKRILAWSGFIGSLAVVTFAVSARFAGHPHEAIQFVAWSCSFVSLMSSVIAAVATSHRRQEKAQERLTTEFASGAWRGALLLGVTAAVIQVVVLVMRLLFVVADLINVFPAPWPALFGFSPTGLWVFVFLIAATLMAWWSTGERRLFVCLVWLFVAATTWLCALPQVFVVTPRLGLQATGATLLWMTCLSTICALAIVVSELIELSSARNAKPGPPPGQTAWPGLRSTTAVLTIAVVMLAAYQLAVPVAVVSLGFRATMVVVCVSVLLTGLSCLILVRRDGGGPLADTALALISLAFCSLAAVFAPSGAPTMAERYPSYFTALIFGLAVATATWAWLGGWWMKRTTAGGFGLQLHWHFRRAAFLASLFALVLATMLALWPRLPAIAVSDDTLASLSAGVAAEIALLLAVLWCAHRFRRLTFHVLTLLVLGSTAGFIAIRILPFASRLD